MRLILVLIFCGLAGASTHAQLVFKSSSAQVPLVELFTSEGCSSCPPADTWLGALRNDPGLWKKFVPIAFHVDYWDHLGWKDPFATPSFSARQWAYSRVWDARIYTPEVVVGGIERRNWRETRLPVRLPKSNPGALMVKVDSEQELKISFAGAALKQANLIVRAAILGFDQSSSINRGENRGRELHHDFVALSYTNARLVPSNDGTFQAAIHFDPLPRNRERLGVAVWVERRGDPRPLQATGGWLKRPMPPAVTSSQKERTSKKPR